MDVINGCSQWLFSVGVFSGCFQVSNPLAAVCNVGAYMHSTNLLVATSLRNVLGTKVTNNCHEIFWLLVGMIVLQICQEN